MAMPAAFLMRRFGYKAGILAGLLLFGVGMLLFWPAAVIGHYGPFLLGCCGSATLETAANPFMAQFGHPSRSARRLNFGGACERAAHYVEGALQELGRGESSSEGPCKPAVWMVEGRVTGGVSAD
jgi:fucose permease